MVDWVVYTLKLLTLVHKKIRHVLTDNRGIFVMWDLVMAPFEEGFFRMPLRSKVRPELVLECGNVFQSVVVNASRKGGPRFS